MYNYFEYFISAYSIVLGLIIGWFIFQIKTENKLITASSADSEKKEA